MRTFMWVAAGLLVLGGAALVLFGSKQEEEEEAPFGYSAMVEQEEGHPSTCGLAYMGRTPDRSHAYKVAVSTRLLEGKYAVLAMQVTALRITDPEAMSGDWAKVESAEVIANGLSTKSLARPGGEETDDYIAVSTDPGELMTFPLDMLNGAELRLDIAGEPALERRLRRVGDQVAGEVMGCFEAIKAFVESAPAPSSANGP